MKILCIEDSLSDFFLIERAIRQSFIGSSVTRIESDDELTEYLKKFTWDFIISDYNLPGFGAKEALQTIHKTNLKPPFIVLSGAIGEEAAIEIMKSGADDVVLKSNIKRLPLAMLRIQRERAAEAEIKKKEDEKARAVTAREEMLAIVSHDLRNPLAAIQLNAELIQSMLDRNEPAVEIQAKSKAILRSAIRMKSLIADILDQVRLEAGTFELNLQYRNVKEFLNEFVEIFTPIAFEKDIQLQLSVMNVEAECLLDFERVYQILSNLVGNALKFTNNGGHVTLFCSLEAGRIHFSVHDTGKGIAKENLNHIFDRFWQHKNTVQHGVGLGLYVVKSLVEKHQGVMSVESELGKGSRFQFSLPTQVRNRGSERALDLKSKRAVVVEDDEDLNEVLVGTLQQMNFEVKSFIRGQDALESIMREDFSADVYLLDYRLPDMSGEKVAEQIVQYQRGANIIFFSAETNIDLIAKKFPNTFFMTKPIRLKDLQFAVERISSNVRQPTL